MGIFLGIDGGGTKTTCAVGNDNALLGTATAGGSNIIRLGERQARESLHQVIQQACAAAGADPKQVQRTCIAVAGAARPEVAEIVRSLVAEAASGDVEVVGDMIAALQAAFGAGPGLVVIAGTGSIAYGRDSEGNTARAGGWGFAVSDEGSGHWIGRAAITAAMRACDERQSTRLLHQILNDWQLASIDDLVHMANATPQPDFASLFPEVLGAADAGDAVARSVLVQAGAELAGLAKIVIRQLFPHPSTVPVAMSGGVFRQSALVRQVFYDNLQGEYSNVRVNSTVVEPVTGALELARKGARG